VAVEGSGRAQRVRAAGCGELERQGAAGNSHRRAMRRPMQSWSIARIGGTPRSERLDDEAALVVVGLVDPARGGDPATHIARGTRWRGRVWRRLRWMETGAVHG
jgi:hypothetical protein